MKLPIPSYIYSARSPAFAHKERPSLSRVALAFFLLIAMPALFPVPANAAEPAHRSEMRLWHSWTAERREILDSIISEFNHWSDDAKVVAQPLGPAGGSVAEQVTLGCAGAMRPDLALVGRESIPMLADEGLIRPFGEIACPPGRAIIPLCNENLLDVARTFATYDGKLYGVPAYLDPFVAIYSPEAVSEAAGVTGPPRDWDSLLNAAQALEKDVDEDSPSWALGVRSMAPLFHILCLQKGIDLYGAHHDAGQAAAVTEILDFIHSLRRRPSLLPPRVKFWNPQFAGVANGKALFQIDTATMLAHLRKETSVSLAAAAVPAGSVSARTALANSPVFVVTSTDKEPAVGKFLDFFYSSERYSSFAEKLLVVSPLKDAGAPIMEAADEYSYSQIVAAAEGAAVYPLRRRTGTVMPRIARTIEKLDAGLISPAQAQEEILDAVKEMDGPSPDSARVSLNVSWAESTRRLFARDAAGSRTPPIRIVAATNEHEAFQLVLSASSEMSDLTLDFAPFVSEDHGPQTIEMSTSLVVDTFISKPMVAQSAGPYPNMIEPRDAFGVSPGRATRIWVDAFVAGDVAPGEYSSSVTVRSRDSVLARAPISLRVLPLKIPTAPSQPAVVGLNYDLIAGRYGLASDSKARRKLMDDFYWFMVERRLSPLQPPVPIDSPELAAYLNDERVSACRIPLGPSDKRFEKAAELAQRIGRLGKMFAYFVDEPMYHRYETIIEAGSLIDAMPASPRFLVTCFPDEPLFDSVDIWCIHMGFLPVGIPAGQMERRRYADIVSERIEAGDEVWWYTAGAVRPFPTLHIEDDPAAFRVIPWLQQLYGIGGFLHWEAANWSGSFEEDPFAKFFGNGEGVLVYPGELRPISSIRLELLREGLEDMEHLGLLRREIEDLQRRLQADRLGDAASKRIGEMCRRLIRQDALRAAGSRGILLAPHFSREPGLIERVREEVAEETISLGEKPYALVLTEPEEKQYTESDEARIYGVVEPGCRIVINGRRVEADEAGNFSALFPLSSGTNSFEVLLRKGTRTKTVNRKIERF